jgi:hypothetical protein
MKQEFKRPVFKYAWQNPQTGDYTHVNQFRPDFKKWKTLTKGKTVICTLTKVKGKVVEETIDSKVIEWEPNQYDYFHLSNIKTTNV